MDENSRQGCMHICFMSMWRVGVGLPHEYNRNIPLFVGSVCFMSHAFAGQVQHPPHGHHLWMVRFRHTRPKVDGSVSAVPPSWELLEAACIEELDVERQGNGTVVKCIRTVIQGLLGLAGGFAAADAAPKAVESWRHSVLGVFFRTCVKKAMPRTT